MGAPAMQLPTPLPQRSAMAIRKLISIATAGSGVRVVFQGRQACTDGEVIILPAMMDAKAERLALAYAWHESFHIQWTDFKAVDGWREAIQKAPILKSIENALEDGRIEWNARQEYPGTHRVINALIEVLVDEGDNLFAEPKKDTHPANLLLGFVLNWTRKEINGYSAIVYLDEWRASLAHAIGEQAVQQVESILDANRMLDSTQESFSVAKEILDVLQRDDESDSDENEGDGDPSESGDDAGDECGSDGESQPDSKDEDDDQQGEDEKSQGGDADEEDESEDQSDDSNSGGDSGQEEEDGDGEDENSQGGDADEGDESEGNADSSAGGDSGETGEQGDSEAGGNAGYGETSDRGDQERQNRESIDSASEDDLELTDLGDLAQEEINEHQEEVAANAQGAGGGFSGGVEVPSAMTDPQLYGRIAAPASALASRLRGILQAETYAEVPYARRSGKRIHRRALHRVAMDDPRIWRRRGQDVDVSAAVHVLLDTSGSMDGLQDQLSTYGLAAARAVEQTDGLTVSASTLINSRYGCTLLKGPHEASVAVAGRFSSMTIGGTTPMAEAMEVAMPLLREADAGHRVMVVFTDGDPNSDSAVEQQMLENPTVRFCAVILGSARNKLESLMPCARIDAMQQLPKVVTDLVRQAITSSNRGGA